MHRYQIEYWVRILEKAKQAANWNTLEATQKLWGGIAHVILCVTLRVTTDELFAPDSIRVRHSVRKRVAVPRRRRRTNEGNGGSFKHKNKNLDTRICDEHTSDRRVVVERAVTGAERTTTHCCGTA